MPLIAFARLDGVYTMRTDGSGVRLLRRTGKFAYWVSWSPDGRRLAFVSTARPPGVWVMNADGNGVRLVTSRGVPSRPSWSPDGRRIAFADNRDGRMSIWIVNADGGNLRKLGLPGRACLWSYEPDWSPSGKQLAISCGPVMGLYVVGADGRGLRLLAPRPDRKVGTIYSFNEPDWSPDGRRIVFTGRTSGCAGADCSYEPRDAEIWVLNVADGSLVRLTDNSVPDYDPVWSPDGRTIAFVGAYAGPGSSEIYAINADGTGFTRLTHNHVSEASPSWQPPAR